MRLRMLFISLVSNGDAVVGYTSGQTCDGAMLSLGPFSPRIIRVSFAKEYNGKL